MDGYNASSAEDGVCSKLNEKEAHEQQLNDDNIQSNYNDPHYPTNPHVALSDLSHSLSYLTGSTESVTTGISLVNVGEDIFTGPVSDRIGKVRAAFTSIMGYEIVVKGKEKYTVYKIRVSCPSSLLGTWFIYRRYSHFVQLRRNLLNENLIITSQISFPPKHCIGSNFDPSFLGKRLAGLEVFLGSILEKNDPTLNQALLAFLSLDKPPMEQNVLETNRKSWETLEVVVKELRKQLGKREGLVLELEYQKNMNSEKDQQMQKMFKENQFIRTQNKGLMSSLSSRRKATSIQNIADLRLGRPPPSPTVLQPPVPPDHLVASLSDIKVSLTLLASILQDDTKDCLENSQKNRDYNEMKLAADVTLNSNNLTEDDDSQSRVEFQDILDQNGNLSREIILLQQQLTEKDVRLKMLEKLLGETHL